MGTSEKGRAEIVAQDFPAKKQVDEVTKEFGAQTEDEASREVPLKS